MSNYCGAPDLPFLQTVLWHLKQLAAVLTIVVLPFLVVGLFLILPGRKRK